MSSSSSSVRKISTMSQDMLRGKTTSSCIKRYTNELLRAGILLFGIWNAESEAFIRNERERVDCDEEDEREFSTSFLNPFMVLCWFMHALFSTFMEHGERRNGIMMTTKMTTWNEEVSDDKRFRVGATMRKISFHLRELFEMTNLRILLSWGMSSQQSLFIYLFFHFTEFDPKEYLHVIDSTRRFESNQAGNSSNLRSTQIRVTRKLGEWENSFQFQWIRDEEKCQFNEELLNFIHKHQNWNILMKMQNDIYVS